LILNLKGRRFDELVRWEEKERADGEERRESQILFFKLRERKRIENEIFLG
jgi:hypothetical protein